MHMPLSRYEIYTCVDPFSKLSGKGQKSICLTKEGQGPIFYELILHVNALELIHVFISCMFIKPTTEYKVRNILQLRTSSQFSYLDTYRQIHKYICSQHII